MAIRATSFSWAVVAGAALATGSGGAQQSDQRVRVELTYRAPAAGLAPDFSPIGTQVPLTALAPAAALPAGAVRPAKKGVLKVGPAESSWIAVLATATPEFRDDLCQIFIDRNRNGRFDDDGPVAAAKPSQNEKTKAWWSSINAVELSVPYGAGGSTEPYLVSFWSVREDGAAAPDVLRYSRRSWRSGRVTVDGVDALVAAMDANNDALFTRSDYWSVVNADAPGADRAVLSHAEARAGSRFMFVTKGDRELVLELRSFSADGRALEFAVVDRPMTKAADRAPDDMVGEERTRPRTRASFEWLHDFNAALAQARAAGRRVFIDFETTWCGPCKTMDQWIWTDAEVAALLRAGYIGVKLDGDIEKALVTRFKVRGYPTMIIVDATGTEVTRAVGYRSSKEMIAFLNK